VNSRKKRRRKPGLWILVFTLSALGAAAFYGFSGAFGSNRPIDPNMLVQVERGAIARSAVATGTIQPRSKVEVKSKASGIVHKILVDYAGSFYSGGTGIF